MFHYRPSIRQKITLGYYAIVLMIIGLSVFTFLELRFIERNITFGAAISEFFDTTLEIRRFEKNYFLYEQQSDYRENVAYVTKAADLVENNIRGFSALSSPAQVETLRNLLDTYRGYIGQYAALNERNRQKKQIEGAARKIMLEGQIRVTGKQIITIAEQISKSERSSLQALLSSSRHVLLLSIILISLSVIAVGQVLSRVVVKPLKLIEKNMEVIADGRFEKIQIDSRDREIASLTNAFNKMLRELELRQRHLVQSEKLASLGTLLSGVAHELNNPLSNISSSNQILIEELKEAQEKHKDEPFCLDPDFTKELLAQINDQADRARNIVRSLLEFSRDKDLKKQHLPRKALFEETIRFLKGQVPATASIALDIPEDVVITADKQRIQQAFLNLIKNSLEAMPASGGTISIKAVKRRAIDDIEDEKMGIYNYLKYRGKCTLEEDTVDIEIRDDGAGIPMDVIPKIFDPFFTTKDVGKGSGLGLFVVHEIIEEHDGCIAVDSEEGKGTTFLMRLPVK
jgi:two-component system NtrC family sensor kinase